jgi:hypothetical protein
MKVLDLLLGDEGNSKGETSSNEHKSNTRLQQMIAFGLLVTCFATWPPNLDYSAHFHSPSAPNTASAQPFTNKDASNDNDDQMQHHKPSRIQERFDEGKDVYSEDEYSEDDIEDIARNNMPNDLSTFGRSLTKEGILTPWLEKLYYKLQGSVENLLTVADDLLNGNGRKFTEMMEQLEERWIAHETEAEYAATRQLCSSTMTGLVWIRSATSVFLLTVLIGTTFLGMILYGRE